MRKLLVLVLISVLVLVGCQSKTTQKTTHKKVKPEIETTQADLVRFSKQVKKGTTKEQVQKIVGEHKPTEIERRKANEDLYDKHMSVIGEEIVQKETWVYDLGFEDVTDYSVLRIFFFNNKVERIDHYWSIRD